MASLPSFVELMASLGLEQSVTATVHEQSPSPPVSPVPRPSARSSSSPSLRGAVTRHRPSRFSPYYSAGSFTRRRGSLSSASSSSDSESSPLRATFAIPPRPAPSSRNRRSRAKLTINIYDSSSDLNADTPISTYVRRGASPTSPMFDRDSGYESSSPPPMPLSIPSLPVLLPNSASSGSFPSTPTSDLEPSSPARNVKPLHDSLDGNNYYRFIRRRTGVRISTPPFPLEACENYTRREHVVDAV